MNFDLFFEALKKDMQPEARAQHVVGSLQPLLAILPDDVTLADLATGWQLLARPHSQEEPASVTHRREVCAQLGTIAGQLSSEPGHMESVVKGWQSLEEACQKNADPRLRAMAKTFARELVELQSVWNETKSTARQA